MDLKIDRQDGIVSVIVSGRIDSAEAVAFEESVRTAIEDGDRAVIFDFETLTYISSAGLRAVLMTAKSVGNQGKAFAVCSVRESIGKVFELSGLGKLITLHPTKSAALDSLDG